MTGKIKEEYSVDLVNLYFDQTSERDCLQAITVMEISKINKKTLDFNKKNMLPLTVAVMC